MSCNQTSYCSNPNIINTGDDDLFCFNCYSSLKKIKIFLNHFKLISINVVII